MTTQTLTTAICRELNIKQSEIVLCPTYVDQETHFFANLSIFTTTNMTSRIGCVTINANTIGIDIDSPEYTAAIEQFKELKFPKTGTVFGNANKKDLISILGSSLIRISENSYKNRSIPQFNAGYNVAIIDRGEAISIADNVTIVATGTITKVKPADFKAMFDMV